MPNNFAIINNMTQTSHFMQKELLPVSSHGLTSKREAMIVALNNTLQTHAAANTEDNEILTGLILIDIRDFRELNRSFGSELGNQILQLIQQRLNTLPENTFNNYYLGNDEFGVVLPELKRSGLTILCTEQLLALFKNVFEALNHTLKITVNCGVAYNYGAHTDPFKLLYDAEDALQQAKIAKQPYRLLGPEHQQEANKQRWQLLNDLHSAMQDDDLSLYFQPKLCLNPSNSQYSKGSAEALIRWESTTHGIVSPNVTLPLIEHLGSEIDLIRWLLNTALKKLTLTDQKGIANSSVSINIPAATVTTKALFELVGEALTIWDIEPERLTLEITEDILIKDKELAFDYLSKIRDAGIKIAIDDFGTGYSSLAYFKHIPADELKIDRAFIHNMLINEADRNLVKWIIELAHTFKLSVVAEGVEDKQTLDLLTSMGCDYAQGFYISRPMPYLKYLDWLAEHS